jgi:hypothetical protein
MAQIKHGLQRARTVTAGRPVEKEKEESNRLNERAASSHRYSFEGDDGDATKAEQKKKKAMKRTMMMWMWWARD